MTRARSKLEFGDTMGPVRSAVLGTNSLARGSTISHSSTEEEDIVRERIPEDSTLFVRATGTGGLPPRLGMKFLRLLQVSVVFAAASLL
mmetsp:Transcript_18267/g.34899  ORF Transcript_18267/g.34899 Transcript_18267/m.34899 type:complete len:89 (+) Transcript_18267:1723-1989(+)